MAQEVALLTVWRKRLKRQAGNDSVGKTDG